MGLHVLQLWQASGRFTKLRNASQKGSIGRLGLAAAAVSKLEAAEDEVVADENQSRQSRHYDSACFTSLYVKLHASSFFVFKTPKDEPAGHGFSI